MKISSKTSKLAMIILWKVLSQMSSSPETALKFIAEILVGLTRLQKFRLWDFKIRKNCSLVKEIQFGKGDSVVSYFFSTYDTMRVLWEKKREREREREEYSQKNLQRVLHVGHKSITSFDRRWSLIKKNQFWLIHWTSTFLSNERGWRVKFKQRRTMNI